LAQARTVQAFSSRTSPCTPKRMTSYVAARRVQSAVAGHALRMQQLPQSGTTIAALTAGGGVGLAMCLGERSEKVTVQCGRVCRQRNRLASATCSTSGTSQVTPAMPAADSCAKPSDGASGINTVCPYRPRRIEESRSETLE